MDIDRLLELYVNSVSKERTHNQFRVRVELKGEKDLSDIRASISFVTTFRLRLRRVSIVSESMIWDGIGSHCRWDRGEDLEGSMMLGGVVHGRAKIFTSNVGRIDWEPREPVIPAIEVYKIRAEVGLHSVSSYWEKTRLLELKNLYPIRTLWTKQDGWGMRVTASRSFVSMNSEVPLLVHPVGCAMVVLTMIRAYFLAEINSRSMPAS